MTRLIGAPANTCLRPADWPEADRRAWERAIAPPRGPFRSKGGGRARNPATQRKTERGYGSWIFFLRQHGQLNPMETPAQRVTPERLDAYFLHLTGCGNADYTVIARFAELKTALRWMQPEGDFRWIMRPNGVALRDLLPMRRREVLVPDTAVLLQWAQDLFAEGLAHRTARGRRALVREAAMIALLTVCAPRLRAMTALRLGVHLRRQGEEWVLDQTPAITKTETALTLPVAAAAGTILDRYVAVERRELLGDAESDALWIAAGGRPLAYETVSKRIRVRARQRFGVPFGPHRFRTSLATSLAMHAPDHPLDAAAILGHGSPATTLKHYNRAKGHLAAQRWSERLRRMRARYRD
ncbi:MAG: tyrosine-type recombinase/integrase [Rhodospirillales bacterium]|nr:tyrosine-type recombinase/integrase [Rhodospirillales bacterium]